MTARLTHTEIDPGTRRLPESRIPIQVRVVDSPALMTEFVEFPKRLFRDDPHWISPLDFEVRKFLSPRHPFRLHGDAELFVAFQEGDVVGRILVSDDPRYNDLHDANLGCFGMFHAVNDPHVFAALLNRAVSWLGQRGRTRMLGPIDYSTNYQAGCLVDGFDTPPRIFMNHNPPWYASRFEDWGLTKAKDLWAWWFTRANSIDPKWRSAVARLGKRFGVRIRPIRMDRFASEVKLFRELYNAAWQDNWGFVKLTEAEFEEFAKGLKQIANPNMVLIAEVDHKPVGLAITVPDLNEAIAPFAGRLTRFGLPLELPRLLWRMRKIRTARLVALGVLPEYRRRGVAEQLIQQTFDYGKDVLGYTGAELSWTLEDNGMINRAIKRVGGSPYKTYRIYRYDWEAAGPDNPTAPR